MPPANISLVTQHSFETGESVLKIMLFVTTNI